jgi:hypothetical protein
MAFWWRTKSSTVASRVLTRTRAFRARSHTTGVCSSDFLTTNSTRSLPTTSGRRGRLTITCVAW